MIYRPLVDQEIMASGHSWFKESQERLLLTLFSQGVWTPSAMTTGHWEILRVNSKLLIQEIWGCRHKTHQKKSVFFSTHVRHYKINRKLVWFSPVHFYTIPQLPLGTWQKLSTNSLTTKRVVIANPTGPAGLFAWLKSRSFLARFCSNMAYAISKQAKEEKGL